MNPLHRIEDPAPAAVPRFLGPLAATWRLGFRPFYLLASVFGSLSVALWALQFAGWLPHPYLAGPLWHAHEMVFGFALAVIVGFLFTAGRNWTNRPTPTQLRLAGLVLLWVAARVLVVTPFATLAAVVDVAFPLAAAVALAIPFIAARAKRNYFFVAGLAGLAVADAVFHLAMHHVIDADPRYGLRVALDVVLFIVSVMGGRVIPMFTNSGVPGAGARRVVTVDRLALGGVLALLAADALGVPAPVVAAIAFAAALAHLARWALWHPERTTRVPLVWVLQLGYLWVPVHLALRAASALGYATPSTATHALTVGAIGGMVIGMMTRTARGHTGEPLVADRRDVAAYAMVAVAALVRVAVPALVPAWTVPAVLVSAALWAAAFALYAVAYAPRLTRPRVDGRDG
jgi:uncharacterized protein involved in response to NO